MLTPPCAVDIWTGGAAQARRQEGAVRRPLVLTASRPARLTRDGPVLGHVRGVWLAARHQLPFRRLAAQGRPHSQTLPPSITTFDSSLRRAVRRKITAPAPQSRVCSLARSGRRSPAPSRRRCRAAEAQRLRWGRVRSPPSPPSPSRPSARLARAFSFCRPPAEWGRSLVSPCRAVPSVQCLPSPVELSLARFVSLYTPGRL